MPSSDSLPFRDPLIERALAGERRAIARLASLIERDDQPGRTLADQIYPFSGRAHRIGITGPPGAGKSSVIARLIHSYRRSGRRVGVVCVDPTSPISGGATLGDRIRLLEFHADADVFIRSMASRGHYGGLATTTASVVHLLDAVGFDPVLIETLGVGQDEVDIANLAHSTVVLQVPGFGDAVQTLKAGLLEVADAFAINKADLPDSDQVYRDLAAMIALNDEFAAGDWIRRIVRVSAVTNSGIEELVSTIQDHLNWLKDSGRWRDRQNQLADAELSTRIRREFQLRLNVERRTPEWSSLVDAVASRRRSPTAAAQTMIANARPG